MPEYNFDKVSTDQIAEILSVALATGDWHEPSVKDVVRDKLSNSKAAYGTFTSSLHNTYRDRKYWFNINKDSVKIWQDASLPGRPKFVYDSINNFRHIIFLIDKYAGEGNT